MSYLHRGPGDHMKGQCGFHRDQIFRNCEGSRMENKEKPNGTVGEKRILLGKTNDGENRVSHDSSPSSLSGELIQLVAVAAVTAATLGYDVGIMAAAIQPIQREMDLNGVQKEFAMGSLNFVAALGAVIGGDVANRKGRKSTVSLACWLFVVGTICMTVAPKYSVLLLGRIITGLGVGVSFVVAPVYLSEVAPTNERGRLNTIFDVAINGGILLGYIIGFLVEISPFVPDSLKWRVMIGFGLLLPVIVLSFLSLLPESPRWLVMANEPSEAERVLLQLGLSEPECRSTIISIQEELELEKDDLPMASVACSWLNYFSLSFGLRLALGLGFWQQVTGTEAVLYYSADFLARAGLQSATERLLGSICVGLCKLIPELLAMQVVDRIGRRPLMLFSAAALTLMTASLSFSFLMHWSPKVVVILLCAVMASFSFGLGPFSFLVASECLGLSERASGMRLCAAVNRCTSGSVALSTVSLYQVVGDAGFFALYAAIGLLSLIYYYTSVPETTGLSLEELAARNRGSAENLDEKSTVDAELS